MLKADRLTKWYGNVLSADSLDFIIEAGEVVGLLGANGAGKSTTMNMLSGCMPPSSGSVSISGIDMLQHPLEARRLIGYLPEIPPLYPDMKVEEQLAFAASLRSVEKRERKREIERVCELTNITDMRRRMVKQLSKGYRQRVGMAQALIGSPQLLIFDEPTAGLDPKQILDIRKLIGNLKKEHTIIISSHILAEISSVCSRLLIMKEGKIVADSSPEELGRAHSGGQQIEARVRGTEEAIRKAIVSINGVLSVGISESPEPGFSDLFIVSEKECDIREQLFNALALASCPAVSLRTSRPSLEEMFIRLTTG